ncbi:MAG: FAD-dependent oxidoreductase [Planctomycetota bacterium]|nr:FAD-dependent oxidoreductase [Planctomycetota bacterium]
MKTVREPGRDVIVARETDVLVCGGGPAGIAAALCAARAGAKTLLLERHPFLGGIWTAGALSVIIDCHNKGGVNHEIRARMDAEGTVEPYFRRPLWNVYAVEAMKHLLDEMMAESGVEVQLYTSVAAAAVENRRVQGVYTESKSGREFIGAQVVIDSSGDGDVAARAGCGYEKGRPSDGAMQPMTLYARLGGLQIDPRTLPRGHLLELTRRCGWDPSYAGISLFPQPGQPGIGMLMATHIYGVDGANARDLTRAEQAARAELKRGVALLKQNGGPEWAEIFLIGTGPFIGVREGRRIMGRYVLTEADVREGRHFDDGICNVQFGIDIHHIDPKVGKGVWWAQVPEYQIPYRCLVARDVDNLLMAGRCISGDHMAHGSYRVTGDAVAMGEAAGLAAALSLERSVDPHALDVPALQARLAELRDATRLAAVE